MKCLTEDAKEKVKEMNSVSSRLQIMIMRKDIEAVKRLLLEDFIDRMNDNQDYGQPYCTLQYTTLLYTNVELDDMCDEKDIKGEYYFAEEKKGADMIGTNNQDGTCNGRADCCKGKD